MYTSSSFDILDVAVQRGPELRAEAEAERLRGTPPTRRALARSLRSAANRLDPASLAPRPASQS